MRLGRRERFGVVVGAVHELAAQVPRHHHEGCRHAEQGRRQLAQRARTLAVGERGEQRDEGRGDAHHLVALDGVAAHGLGVLESDAAARGHERGNGGDGEQQRDGGAVRLRPAPQHHLGDERRDEQRDGKVQHRHVQARHHHHRVGSSSGERGQHQQSERRRRFHSGLHKIKRGGRRSAPGR